MRKKPNPPAPKKRPPPPPGPPRPRGLGVPVWRKNPPTEPGLYWFTLRTTDTPGEGALRFCRVVKGEAGLTLGHRNYDADAFLDVVNLQRWWAGPLLEPDE